MTDQTGIQETYFSSRLGNAETLVWPSSVPTALGPSAVATTIPNADVLLLEADASNLAERWGPSTWVLTLDAVATYPPFSPANRDRTVILPARAVVTIGTGGSRQVLELDVRNNSVALPASNVSVRIGWDKTIPDNQFNGYLCPDSVRVFGQLQRGYSGGTGKRSLVLGAGAADELGTRRGLIPNFARCARLWGGRFDLSSGNLWYVADNRLLWKLEPETTSNLQEPLDYVPGDKLLNPSGVPVPALASSWLLRQSGAAQVTPGYVPKTLEFDIAL